MAAALHCSRRDRFIDTRETSMRALWNRASIGWCRTFHPETLWPVHGHYRCRACLRIYLVPWHEAGNVARPFVAAGFSVIAQERG